MSSVKCDSGSFLCPWRPVSRQGEEVRLERDFSGEAVVGRGVAGSLRASEEDPAALDRSD